MDTMPYLVWKFLTVTDFINKYVRNALTPKLLVLSK